MIVNHLEECGLFSDFQYGFRSSQSIADLMAVAYDRIARAFNRSGTTRSLLHMKITLQMLQKASIKIVANAIYTYPFFFLYIDFLLLL